LGFDHAKGMYDIGLLSKKSLFQLFAERLIRLNGLVHENYAAYMKNRSRDPINWYIMTSDANDEEVRKFFHDNNNFGLRR